MLVPVDASAPATRARAILAGGLCWAAIVTAAYYGRNLWELYERLGPAIRAAATVLFAAEAAGFCLLRAIRWTPANWREAVPFQFCVGAAAISYSAYGLALLNLYKPVCIRWFIDGVLVGCGFTAILLLRREFRSARTVRDLRSPRQRTWMVLSLVAAGVALIGALAPEIEYDALNYHLFIPKLWLEYGHPVDVVWEIASLYPLTWEMVYGCAMALGGPVAAKLIHFATLMVCAVLVYEMSRRYAPGVSPWFSVGVLLTAPTVMWEATTAYIDLALMLCATLALYGALQYFHRRGWQWLALTAFALGFGIATKHLGLVVAGIVTGGLWLALWRRERRFWQSLATVLPLSVALLFPIPWYLRAWSASGNPFFPEFYRIFGAEPPGRMNPQMLRSLEDIRDHVGPPRTVLGYLSLPFHMTVRPAAYRGALGPCFLLMVPFAFTKRRRGVWMAAAGFALSYFLIWASPALSFHMRFLLPAVPALALLAAAGYARFRALIRARYGPDTVPIAAGVLAALLTMNLPWFINLHEVPLPNGYTNWIDAVVREVPTEVVFGGEPEKVYLARRLRSYAAWDFINAHLPRMARILTFSEGDNFYSERDRVPYFSSAVLPSIEAPPNASAAAVARLHGLGITHILFDRRLMGALQRSSAIADPAWMRAHYTLEYEDPNFLLYRL